MTAIKTATKEKGFTIIEVMIAMGIFTVIVTIGIAAVLNAIQQHKSSENTRTVMDNLNFVMEDMARNIRLGQNIRCVIDPTETGVVVDTDGYVVAQDCPAGRNKIVLNDQNGDYLTYVISVPSMTGGPASQIYKLKGNDPTKAQLVSPPEIKMDFDKSGFIVRGALPGDLGQPNVLIRLAGTVTYQGVDSKFAVETSVTLRGLDS